MPLPTPNADARTWRDVLLYTLAAVTVGVIAWALQLLLALQGQVIEMRTIQNQQLGLLDQITERLEKLDGVSDDHERRLTRREGDPFTSRDGAELAAAVARNSATIAQQTDRLELLRSDLAKLRGGLRTAYARLTAEKRGGP